MGDIVEVVENPLIVGQKKMGADHARTIRRMRHRDAWVWRRNALNSAIGFNRHTRLDCDAA